MNIWQILRQLKYLLLARVWTGSGNVVFPSGSVKVSEQLTENVKQTGMRTPICVLAPGVNQTDPEHREEPDLFQQDVRATVIVSIPGDQVGENPMIGANVPDRTKSEGRGLLEIEEELFNAIGLLNTDFGVVIQSSSSGAAMPSLDPTLGYVLSRDYMFQAWATASRYYHAPTRLQATALGGGSVSLSWVLPPDRFDRYQIILRRASGSTAPSSVTGGTGVTLSGNLATSVTDTPGAGTWSYSVWCGYDENHTTPSASNRYSSQEGGSTRTIVAT